MIRLKRAKGSKKVDLSDWEFPIDFETVHEIMKRSAERSIQRALTNPEYGIIAVWAPEENRKDITEIEICIPAFDGGDWGVSFTFSLRKLVIDAMDSMDREVTLKARDALVELAAALHKRAAPKEGFPELDDVRVSKSLKQALTLDEVWNMATHSEASHVIEFLEGQVDIANSQLKEMRTHKVRAETALEHFRKKATDGKEDAN